MLLWHKTDDFPHQLMSGEKTNEGQKKIQPLDCPQKSALGPLLFRFKIVKPRGD